MCKLGWHYTRLIHQNEEDCAAYSVAEWLFWMFPTDGNFEYFMQLVNDPTLNDRGTVH